VSGPARPLRFRPATAADVPRLMEIEQAGFRRPWSEALLRRELENAWSSVVVAVEEAAGGERVVGYCISWLVHDEVHVLNIATAPEARRLGVGRALMRQATERGRQRGARLATLEVRRSNEAALALYRSLGYRQVGVRSNYYAEEAEDAIVMLLDLEVV
jgi:ribosomal-protein-alanine N-acetyltransferase